MSTDARFSAPATVLSVRQKGNGSRLRSSDISFNCALTDSHPLTARTHRTVFQITFECKT